ncbi:4-hydroxy-tetrahydrodipicolinate synthase [Virgibacillus phasianinus]|uniref:4-hydroxy-tetrahydrodipicolinate synthase n=1 Tax=Virgibacillus phasianinus TaxID=2017483 RepID=A0A220U6M1_9BACI|nr:4-hydroxy-tetrahydrodipicolinate synthase [Virgibacillus phasianinus]ASK63798.1 4-hydroxy-tetrahydrodipicolinate synthase [Virgibacillus phasianinus]
MAHIFTGIGAAVPIPFSDEKPDYNSFQRHLQFLMENNIQCLVINGTTGEGSTLSLEEKNHLLEIAVETAAGKVPVIAGTGSNSTKASIEASKAAKNIGVDGLLLITPYYNKTSQRGLIEHFTSIVDSTGLPAILYNVPSRTGMTIEPETVKALSKHKYIVGLKDATGDLNYFSKAKLLTDESFAFYSGNDDTALPYLALGGDGVISVAANALPNEFQTMYERSIDNLNEAKAIHYRLYPLLTALGVDVNPIPIKVLTAHLGFGSYDLRLPLVPLEANEQQKLIETFDLMKAGA